MSDEVVEVDANEFFERRERRRSELIGRVVRRARVLRDLTRNSFRGLGFGDAEPEAREAWEDLDEALTALDDFSAGVTR